MSKHSVLKWILKSCKQGTCTVARVKTKSVMNVDTYAKDIEQYDYFFHPFFSIAAKSPVSFSAELNALTLIVMLTRRKGVVFLS